MTKEELIELLDLLGFKRDSENLWIYTSTFSAIELCYEFDTCVVIFSGLNNLQPSRRAFLSDFSEEGFILYLSKNMSSDFISKYRDYRLKNLLDED